MSTTVKGAGLFGMAASLLILLFSAAGSGAAAQDHIPTLATSAPLPSSSQPGFDSLSAESGATAPTTAASPAADAAVDITPAPVDATHLADLVAAQPQVAALSQDLNCLASAIYFEARHASLAGQLAVGKVIVARTKSGRFPTNYCGVVTQRSQFSFVHGGAVPAANTSSPLWHNAVAVAEIAHNGNVRSAAEGALFFHSARIQPHWNRTRVAMVDGNVFYR